MFTPQRKVNNWSVTPHKNGGSSTVQNPRKSDAKGKSSNFSTDITPPPVNFLGENGGGVDGDGDMEVWRRFKEGGFLDEAALEKKDRKALVDRVSKLEKELFEYQYNMGLLLIEKKEWTAQYDEVRDVLAEAQECLKREQTSHLISISEVEKREENLKNALGVQRQCVDDLEKALREMRAECAETKYNADAKMTEAHALVASLEEKSLEVEAKLHAADAKLAEATRKSSEIERKLKEVEARESALRSERQSSKAEQEMNEAAIAKQREELREWERTLQEREDRLIDGRRILNQREERANEMDRTLKQKQKDVDEIQKLVEKETPKLKQKEEDLNIRLAELVCKEKEADASKEQLEIKEKELLALEDKLNARERVEIQKLLDEHNVHLESRRREFELELEQQRKSLAEELKSKAVAVEQREAEIHHMEEKIGKREQAVEKKMEKFKEKEKDLDLKWKEMKEKEKSVKSQEKDLEKENKKLLTEKENMQNLTANLEKIRADIEEQKMRLCEEEEKLKVTEEERTEHLRLKSELKHEIAKCKHEEELLLKEHEGLKQDKENFEREWEVLDEKKAEITKELKQVREESERLQKLKQTEEERLKTEKLETHEYVQKELELLRLQKESFEAEIEHERSVISEKARTEREDMLRDFELRKRELEVNMQNQREEMEKELRDRERAFEEHRERELNNINYLREVAGREMEDMKLERTRMEKEREKIATNKQHLEEQQRDMQKDIEKLDNLIKGLKEQRKQFNEIVEKNKCCKNCGVVISESEILALQNMEDTETIPLPRLSGDHLEDGTLDGSNTSGGRMSWLRKCTSKIINLSPLKKITKEEDSQTVAGESLQHDVDIVKRLDDRTTLPEPSTSIRELQYQPTLSYDEHSNIESKGQDAPEDSEQSELNNGRGKGRKKRLPGVKRTRSVKEVVEDARVFLGEALELNEDSSQFEDNQRDTTSLGRKRSHAQTTASEQEADDNDTRSESVTTGGRRKRRQTVAPELQTPGERRYNLRPPKKTGKSAAAKSLLDHSKGKEKETDGNKIAEVEASQPETPFSHSAQEVAGENGQSTHLVQVTTLKSATEVREFTINTGDGNDGSKTDDARRLGENMEMSITEGTQIYGEREEGDEYGSEVGGDDEDEEGDSETDDDDNESDLQPGEASVGKKIWTFFTT
ncbi:hypothetical protein MKW94_005695 [Papaver nudicaule]|uniref:Nuclear matrix constituent protein 1-like protein n=1 Tax=Papaver nudicaule TaxID=74823 RepID=A0AA41V2S3_PAPNU|nr:hypothetical protein [Papaver nudicaule]